MSSVLLYKNPPTEAEAAAQLFAETAAQKLLDRSAAQDYAVTKSSLVSAALLTHANGRITLQFSLAVRPADPECSVWKGADLTQGTGANEGDWLYTREAQFLFDQKSGSWSCIGIYRIDSPIG